MARQTFERTLILATVLIGLGLLFSEPRYLTGAVALVAGSIIGRYPEDGVVGRLRGLALITVAAAFGWLMWTYATPVTTPLLDAGISVALIALGLITYLVAEVLGLSRVYILRVTPQGHDAP